MEKINYSKIIKQNWRIITSITAGVLILVFIFNLANLYLYPEYRSTVQLLIIQNQNQKLDAYTAVKSAQELGKNLSEVIYTTSFFDKVMSAGFSIDNVFPADENKKRQMWRNMIETEVIPETGILKINVYHPQGKQAAQIAQAIAYILITQGQEYHGGGSDIQIKMVDSPLTSKYPVRPNILLNSFAGLIFGFVLAIMYIILKESRKIEKEKNSQPTPEPIKHKDFVVKETTRELPLELPKKENFINTPPAAPKPARDHDSIITMYDHLNR
jgi:capsular polysaccharide biosynthesis protein